MGLVMDWDEFVRAERDAQGRGRRAGAVVFLLSAALVIAPLAYGAYLLIRM